MAPRKKTMRRRATRKRVSKKRDKKTRQTRKGRGRKMSANMRGGSLASDATKGAKKRGKPGGTGAEAEGNMDPVAADSSVFSFLNPFSENFMGWK
mgnify:CR=1 FL=1